jgi:hypothetical protein
LVNGEIIGSTGPQGSTGAQGGIGAQGPQGSTGPQGQQGDRYLTQSQVLPSGNYIDISGSYYVIKVALGLAYTQGNSIMAAGVAMPTSGFQGHVRSYNSATGYMIIMGITNVKPPLSLLNSYTINLNGIDGAQGSIGAQGPQGSTGGFTPLYSSVSNVQGVGVGYLYTFYDSPKYIINGLSTITGYIEYSANTSIPSTTLFTVIQGGSPIWYVSAVTLAYGYLNFSVILETGSYSFRIINDNAAFVSTPKLSIRAIRHV